MKAWQLNLSIAAWLLLAGIVYAVHDSNSRAEKLHSDVALHAAEGNAVDGILQDEYGNKLVGP